MRNIPFIQKYLKVRAAINTERFVLPHEQAIEFRNLLLQNIQTQKFAGTYDAYKTEKYIDYKMNRVGHLKFWILDEHLINAIEVTQISNDHSRVDAAEGNEGKKAYVHEYGGTYRGRRYPARPVFTPTRREFRRTQGKRVLKRIASKIRRIWGG